MNFDKLLGSVSGNTISGDVDIRISKDIGLKTKLETVSGDIDVFPSIRTLEKSKRSFEGTHQYHQKLFLTLFLIQYGKQC